MNITLARTMLQERGYALEMRDEKHNSRPCCRLYAVCGTNEHFLCSLRSFIKTGTKTFRHMIQKLPENEATPC